MSESTPTLLDERRAGSAHLGQGWTCGHASGVILLAYFGSRLWRLTLIPAFVDESIHLLWSYRLATHGLGEAIAAGRLLPILAYALPVHLATDPLLAARLVSVLMGSIALVGVGWTGARLVDTRTGLVASALYALCPFTFFYDRLALADSFCCAGAALTMLALFRLLELPRPRQAVSVGLAMSFTALSKLTALFVLLWPACALGALGRPSRGLLRMGALAYLVAAVMILPFAIPFLVTTSEFQQMASTESTLFSRLSLLERNLAWSWHWLWVLWTAPFSLLAVVGAAFGLFERRSAVLALVAATLVPALTLSVVAREYFPRYLLPATAPFLILAAWGLIAVQRCLERRLPAWPAWGWALVLAAASLPALQFDMALATDPLKAPLPEAERDQYLTGWPSGYGFPEAARYLRAEGVSSGELTTIAIDRLGQTGPFFALSAMFMKEPQVRIVLVDVETPGDRQRIAAWARMRPVFLVVSAERLEHATRAALTGMPLLRRRTFFRPTGAAVVSIYRVGDLGDG